MQTRLAIFTRRFWPHCGTVETEAAQIAGAIHQMGQSIEIITVRWQNNWPRDFEFREMNVNRINRPIGGPWGMFRFLRRLNRHVKDQTITGLIVYGLNDESWAAIRNFAATMPVFVRVISEPAPAKNERPFNSRQLAILKNVKRILVDSEIEAQRLTTERHVPADLISIAPIFIPADPEFQRSLNRTSAVRRALSDAHPILEIEPTDPLALCATAHFADEGMMDLIDAWALVLDRFPKAKLWIVGDGLAARDVWDRICDLGLANSIIMPGFFDELDDVLLAADIYVHPLRRDVVCAGLQRALATGTCTISSARSAGVGSLALHHETIEKNVNGLLVPVASPAALAEGICLALNHSDLRARLGQAAARLQSKSQVTSQDWIEQMLEPFCPDYSGSIPRD